jgi:hypothetical protein
MIVLLLIIIIFFAYTGINLNKPEKAMYILVDKVVEINKAINRMFINLVFNIRTSFQERFSR